MNSDEYRSLQLKFDALEKKKRSEQDFNEKKIDQLHHQLDALIFKDSDESWRPSDESSWPTSVTLPSYSVELELKKI